MFKQRAIAFTAARSWREKVDLRASVEASTFDEEQRRHTAWTEVSIPVVFLSIGPLTMADSS